MAWIANESHGVKNWQPRFSPSPPDQNRSPGLGFRRRSGRGFSRILAPLIVLSALLAGPGGIAAVDYVAKEVPDENADPFRYTGWIVAGAYQGSGVVVGTDYTVVTAGHLAYDDQSYRWMSSMLWMRLAQGRQTTFRSYKYFASYADAVVSHGTTASETFSHDFVAAFAYEPVTNVGHAIPAVDAAQLVTGGSSKMISGYPTGLFPDHPRGWDSLYYTGQFTAGFVRTAGSYYRIDHVSMGPGGSGGPLWLQEEGRWRVGGILVSGLAKKLGDSIDTSGVVILDGAKSDLLQSAITAAMNRPPVTDVDGMVITGGAWSEGATMAVQVNNLSDWTPSLVRWDGSAWVAASEFPLTIDGEIVSWKIPPGDLRWHGVHFKLNLDHSGEATIAMDLGSFTYTDFVGPTLSVEAPPPSSLPGATLEYAISLSGVPEPSVEWSLISSLGTVQPLADLPNDSPIAPFVELSQDRRSLKILPNGGFLDDARVLISAKNFVRSNEFRTTISYAEGAEKGFRVVQKPDGVIPFGGIGVVRLEPEVPGHTVESRWIYIPSHVTSKHSLPISWRVTANGGLRIANDGSALDGCVVSADVRVYGPVWERSERFYYGDGRIEPLTLHLAGAPYLSEPQFSEEQGAWSVAYSSAEKAHIEWQVWSGRGAFWEPVSETIGFFETSDEGSSMVLPAGAGLEGLWRAKLIEPSGTTRLTAPISRPWVGAFPAGESWDVELGPDWELKYVKSTADTIVLHCYYKTWRDGRILTFRRIDDEWVALTPLATPPGVDSRGYGRDVAVFDDSILVAHNFRPQDGSDHIHHLWSYAYDPSLPGWGPPQEIVTPIGPEDVFFGAKILEREGEVFAPSTAGTSVGYEGFGSVFQLEHSAPGQWSVSQRFRPPEDLGLNWIALGTDMINEGNNLFVLSAPNSRPNLHHFVRESAELDWRYFGSEVMIADALYRVGDDRLLGVRRYSEARGVSLFPFDGLTIGPALAEQPMGEGMIEKGVAAGYLAYAVDRQQRPDYPGGAIYLLRVGRDSVEREPTILIPRDAMDYAADVLDFSLCGTVVTAVSLVEPGHFRVHQFDLNDLSGFPDSGSAFPMWTRTVAAPSGAIGVRYREAVSGPRRVRILALTDASTWQPFVPAADALRVVDPDADGDGVTQEVELRLPAPVDGDQVYYQLQEVNAGG